MNLPNANSSPKIALNDSTRIGDRCNSKKLQLDAGDVMKKSVTNFPLGGTNLPSRIRLGATKAMMRLFIRGKQRRKISMGLGILLSLWLIYNTITLIMASSKPIDAVFVLGGSIQREIYVSRRVNLFANIPILISQGSKDPCIRLVFERENAPMENVWLEKCAKSTFGNFVHGLPILQSWRAKKVKLITSGSHVFRSAMMGKIIFGAHGIWVETEIVTETGRPGNRESRIKTVADIGRSLIWAGISQVFQPQCGNVINLAQVDMNKWIKGSFQCEKQGNLQY